MRHRRKRRTRPSPGASDPLGWFLASLIAAPLLYASPTMDLISRTYWDQRGKIDGLMYVIGGKLIDALGTRVGFFLIMLWWSLACASHGLATGFTMLAISRLMLGAGEGGGFPAATKAMAEWFPVRERSTAMGLINAGTAVGGIIAPPAIAAILSYARWPWVFYLSGAAGLAWTVWWLQSYYPPARHPRRAASIVAMSILFIGIIASKARFASAPPAAIASVSARGVICQERPQRSRHHPQALSSPPLPTIAFQ